MKLTAYKDLESSKRAQTMSRIILIGGAHLIIIGGAYLVTNFGGDSDSESASMAGVGTWSNNSPDAEEPSVDPSASTLFDSRAGDLSGYNQRGDKPVYLAQNSASEKRFAPRRPSDSGGSSPASQPTPSGDGDDDILQPVYRSSSELYPDSSSFVPDSSLSQTIEYKVQNGDSLWKIAQRFKVSVSEITAANPGIKANAILVGQTLNIPRSSDSPSISVSSNPTNAKPETATGPTYTVKSGDVLSRIASRQGITVAELKAANNLRNDTIQIGQKLVIPTKKSNTQLASQQHRGPKVTIEAGDTLDKYAAIYGVSISELMKLNNISNPKTIRIGQTLLIPEKASSRISSPQPQAQTTLPPRSQPTRERPQTTTRPQQEQPLQSLDDLAPDEEPPPLTSLEDEFGVEDQPLIQIQE